VEDAGYRMAWFGQAPANGKPQVKPISGAGLQLADLDEGIFLKQAAKNSQGQIKAALSTGLPVIVRNIFTDAENKRWRTEAARWGYASFVVLPLPGKKSLSSLLLIYAVEADAFGFAEMELLKQLVSDLPPQNDGLVNRKGQ
jgi:hypothetical protein